MKILGIDEAGRGPVIGSLFMCGYLIDSKKVHELRKIGVKDSKLLSRKQRQDMFQKLKGLADDIVVKKLDAEKIDTMRTNTNLNKIEINKMRELIQLLNPDKVVIDAIEKNVEKFHSKISYGFRMKIITENFADKNYPEVSAASICAKINRDREIDSLHGVYGDFGSGYTSDPSTIMFLKDCIKKNKVPDCVRKSWMTFRTIMNEKRQTTLNAW
jgi:ribonuclease HII